MKAEDLRVGMKVRTTRDVPDSRRRGVIVPKETTRHIKKVIGGKAFITFERGNVEIDPTDLDRVG